METNNQEKINNQDKLEKLAKKNAMVFEGGGILGASYTGALVRLHELVGPLKVKNVAGSSVGSLIATALACGANPYYIHQRMMELDLTKFKDGGCCLVQFFRLLFKYGSHKGDYIETFIGDTLQDLTQNRNITFQEAYERFGCFLTITYLSTDQEQTIYANHLNHPHHQIKTVARWSSSIPLFFQAPRQGTDLILDGAVLDSYPLHILRDISEDKDIIGFKLYNDQEIKIPRIRNLKDYAFVMVNILREQALRYHVEENDWKLTCRINVGKYKTTDFNITQADKEWLYNAGREGMDKFLKLI